VFVKEVWFLVQRVHQGCYGVWICGEDCCALQQRLLLCWR
jgi:hypothetical protein